MPPAHPLKILSDRCSIHPAYRVSGQRLRLASFPSSDKNVMARMYLVSACVAPSSHSSTPACDEHKSPPTLHHSPQVHYIRIPFRNSEKKMHASRFILPLLLPLAHAAVNGRCTGSKATGLWGSDGICVSTST